MNEIYICRLSPRLDEGDREIKLLVFLKDVFQGESVHS